ncbi:hypothetical protein LJB93_02920 [Desulfovibrio sp. OttesenSCG-928-F07]|nr:hypothetical protein [Desulfovibrio sp. OttesenSCG-928-F07]
MHMFRRGPHAILAFIALFAVFSLFVMLLWNAIMPELTGFSTVNYPQAAGLLALCRILLGGIGGMGFSHRARMGHFNGLPANERDALIKRMHERYDHRHMRGGMHMAGGESCGHGGGREHSSTCEHGGKHEHNAGFEHSNKPRHEER